MYFLKLYSYSVYILDVYLRIHLILKIYLYRNVAKRLLSGVGTKKKIREFQNWKKNSHFYARLHNGNFQNEFIWCSHWGQEFLVISEKVGLEVLLHNGNLRLSCAFFSGTRQEWNEKLSALMMAESGKALSIDSYLQGQSGSWN